MPAPGARAKAKALGLKTYVSTTPCKNGHLSERSVSGGNCLECQRAWFKDNAEHVADYKRDWAETNADDLKAYHADYYRQNPERWVLYHEENRELRNEQDKQRRAANIDKHRAYDRAYMSEYTKKNADAVRAHKRNNEAKRKAAPGKHTAADIRALFEAQKGRCAYCEEILVARPPKQIIVAEVAPEDGVRLIVCGCGAEFWYNGIGRPAIKCPACRKKRSPLPVAYHVDHILPIVRGGSNDPSNLCLSCPTCNMSKQDLTGAEFRAQRSIP